jgi:hypothetical protein
MTITEKDAGRKVKVRDGWIVTIMTGYNVNSKPFSYVHPTYGFISVSEKGEYLVNRESVFDIVGFYEAE